MQTPTAILKLAIFCMITINGALAQLPDYHVQLINARSGVSLSGAKVLIQDKAGFLWILSENKLQRFDGRNVKVFTPAPMLSNIFCDADGGIWCVAQRSVSRYVNDHAGFQHVAVDSNADFLFAIHQLPDKTIWCSHTKGLLKYSASENRFIAFPVPFLQRPVRGGRLARGIIKGIEQYGHSFCLLQQDSAYVLNVRTGALVKNTLPKLNYATFVNERRLLLTSFDARSYAWELPSNSISKKAWRTGGIAANDYVYVSRILPAGEHNYYLLTNKGLLQSENDLASTRKVKLFLDGMPLPAEETIRHITPGDDGKIFLLHETGLLFFDMHRHGMETIKNLSYDLSKNFGDGPTECVMDDQENLWIASFNGFTRWNLRTNQYRQYLPHAGSDRPALQHPVVWHIAWDGKKILLTPDQQGLLLFDPRTEVYSRPVFARDSTGKKTASQLNNATIYFIRQLRNGNFLLANRYGVYLVQKDTYRVSPVSLPKNVMFYLTAVEMDDGSLWFGTMNGLVGTDSNFVLKKRIEMPGAHKEALVVCQPAPGELLAGNEELYRITGLWADTPSVKQHLPYFTGKTINALYKDVLGYIWVGTTEGVYRCDARSTRVSRITDPDFVIRQHQLNDFYEAKDGTVFFCSENGLNYFRPTGNMAKEKPPRVFITNVTVNNNDSGYLQRGSLDPRLAYDQNSLVFDFVSPAYGTAAMHYRYFLEGFDSKWVDAGHNTQVRYAALPPGAYRFVVSASRDGINWYPSQQTIGFTIAAPFWRTGWFMVLCITAAAAAGYAVYRYRQNRHREKQVKQMVDYFANSGYEHSSVEDILWDIARNCISRLNFEDCVIYLLDEEKEVLVQKAAYGPKSPKAFEILNPIAIPLGKGIVGTVAQTGKAEIVKDTTTDERYIVDDKARLSEITVPIIHEGKVIGIIDSESTKRNFFKEKHIQVLQTIANLCSAKISRAMALDAMQKSKLQLMELNMKMAESKFLNLRLQMNPHFLFNSLSSIQHLVVSQQTSKAYKYLTVFSNLLRSLLQYADSNFISLDRELAMLRMYLDLETLRFEESFRYSIEVDESLEQEEVLIPSLMVQPFAENAIWHGLMHKEGNKLLHIRFNNHHDEYLTCIIEDNGIGRKSAAAIQQKKISSMVHESKGIRIIRERLSLLQKKTGKPAQLDIIDKMDEASMPAGTKVIIIIPFYNREEA